MAFPLTGTWIPTVQPTNVIQLFNAYGIPPEYHDEMRLTTEMLGQEITEQGGRITITTKTAAYTQTIGPFTLGQPFDSTVDGESFKVTFRMEGKNKVIMENKHTTDSSKSSTEISEVNGNELVQTLCVGGVNSVSKYKRA